MSTQLREVLQRCLTRGIPLLPEMPPFDDSIPHAPTIVHFFDTTTIATCFVGD